MTTQKHIELPYPMLPRSNEPAKSHSAKRLCDLELDSIALNCIASIKAGKHTVLSGKAGTGKTQLATAVIQDLVESGKISTMWTREPSYYADRGMQVGHRTLKVGCLGFVVISLSRRAVLNAAQRMPTKFKVGDLTYNLSENVLTFHAFMEYVPVRDQQTGEVGRFVASRNEGNAFPEDLKLVVIEEASMLTITQMRELVRAVQPTTQFLILGDLGQVASIGGMSVLAASISYLPYFELEKVHRSAGYLQKFGHNTRDGLTTVPPPKGDSSPDGSVIRAVYGEDVGTRAAANMKCGNLLFSLWKSGNYIPAVDLATCPQHGWYSDKAEAYGYGIFPIWFRFASLMDKYLQRHTYYVKTRKAHHVLAHGDVVFADIGESLKEHIIVYIRRNPAYTGANQFGARMYHTREPAAWMALYERDEGIDYNDMPNALEQDDDHNLLAEIDDLLAPVTVEDSEAGQGRRSPYALVMVSLSAMSEHLMDTGIFGEDKDSIMAQLVTVLTKLALGVSHDVNVDGHDYTPNDVVSTVLKAVRALGLDIPANFVSTVTSSAQISEMLPMILSTYKAQGSEARNAIFLSSSACHTMTREVVYTSCTRARRQLITLTHRGCWGAVEGEPAQAGVLRQSIKGITVDEKAEHCRNHLERLATDVVSSTQSRGQQESSDDLDTADALWAVQYMKSIARLQQG